MANTIVNIIYHPDFPRRAKRTIGAALIVTITAIVIAMLVFDHEPSGFSVLDRTVARANDAQQARVTRYVTTATLLELINTLLDKRGGYLSNDIAPPGILMDNVPNWEWGVLIQIRDAAVAMRNDFSRSQSQSVENPDLIEADNRIRIDSEKWIFPAAENEYRDAAAALARYLESVSNASESRTQFFACADNLQNWLVVVGKRLRDLS